MPLAGFSPAHLAVLAAVGLSAAALAALVRRWPGAERPLRAGLAAAIASNELAFYAHALAEGWVEPPRGLPLDLCDVAVWLTVYALVAPRPWVLDATYYVAVAGSGMALVTPDVGAAPGSYPAVKFFVSHGAVVAAVLFLVWSGALRPRPGSWRRVFLWVNAYAALVALVNARFGTNYLYLCEKPESATLLDVLGPWPWYVLAGEVVALALFWLLERPFRRRGAATARRRYAPTRARRRSPG